jgi:hypothetical protein
MYWNNANFNRPNDDRVPKTCLTRQTDLDASNIVGKEENYTLGLAPKMEVSRYKF